MSRSPTRSESFRSLADQLRGWPDDRLTRLLVLRPDLVTPAPHDCGQLASRATTRSSLLRALDQLNRLELFVLDALVVSGQTTSAGLVGRVRANRDAVQRALTRLEDLALVWQSAGGLRVLTGVADGLTGGGQAGVSGLRPASPDPRDEATLTALLAELSAPARTLLDHVLDHGGEATTGTSRHTVSPTDAATPAEELLARRLLVPRSGGSVVLPGEVGLVLRGGTTTTYDVDDAPEVATTPRGADQVERAAAGAAFELVRRVELLLEHWGTRPPTVLRSGGLAVRDLKATATLLLVDEATAALLVETAAATGLLARTYATDGQAVWAPTDLYDTWSTRPVAQRWTTLARAWLESPRLPGLVGERDPTGKTWNALVTELSSMHAPETRRMTLAVLADLPLGEVLATGTGVASVVERVSWERPRRPRSRVDQVAWTLVEAAVLGVTGLGGLASYARLLVGGDDPAPALEPLLPEPVDHVLLQADLTAVAPGPLESALARRLQQLADVESRGGATTYRFTPDSVRRALDTGWSALEVHEFLGSVSRTSVPQPLSYLVDDTARTYGSIRVGHAEAFLRADDETALTELLHHPRSGGLGLRRIAPTVLVSTSPLVVLLPRLRELGAAPVVEAADGTVHVARPDLVRARAPREARPAGARSAHATAQVARVVRAVRAGDRADEALPLEGVALTPAGSLSVLREAVEGGTSVLIGYVDNHGTSSHRVVDPISVEGGQLTAHDHRADDVRTFAVHRITTVEPLSSVDGSGVAS